MTNVNDFNLESSEKSAIFSNGRTSIEMNFNPLRYTIKNVETSEIIFENVRFGFSIETKTAGQSKKVILWCNEFAYIRHELGDSLVPGNDSDKAAYFYLEAYKAKFSGWIAFDLAPGKSRVIIKCAIGNKNNYPVHMNAMHVLAIGKRRKTNAIEPTEKTCFNGTSGDLKVYYNGYQSWSLARTFGVKERQYHAALRIGDWVHQYKYMSIKQWVSRPRGLQESNGVTVITDSTSKRSVTIGFGSALSQHGEIKVHIDRKSRSIANLEAVALCERKLLPPDGEIPSELLYVQDRNGYPACLDEYADVVAECMNSVFWNNVPFGFCTWYYYYSKINETEMLKNLTIITDKAKNPYFQIDYFQLDDGYEFTQGQCGDWRRYNPEKFPGGFTKIVDEISSKHLVPGLWIAPFNAMPGSDLALAHPDWILKNQKGKPIKPTFVSGKFQYALDLTHPEVKEYLKDLITFFVRELGFKYIKIDFVFSSITEDAVFRDENITRVEAYRDALRIIREAAGDDTFILGCGAPLMESVGFVNGMRISTDTDPHWARFDSVMHFFDILIPGMKHALLNTITRSWMHKKFWINDPDCLMVRMTKTKLTKAEVMTQIAIIGLSGGQVAISDDLALLPEDQFRMIALVQPPYTRPAYSPDMFVHAAPELYMVEGSSQDLGSWKVVAMINWQKRRRDMSLDMNEIGCNESKKYHVIDFWNEKYLGTFNGNENVTLQRIAPHGCKLLRVTEDPGPEDAILLGTTLHVLQGAVEVEIFHYDATEKLLSIVLAKYGKNQGSIFVKIPSRCFFETTQDLAEKPTYNIKEIAETIFQVQVTFETKLELDLKLEMA